MSLSRIEIRRPQMIAAALLLIFAAQCLWVVKRQQMTRRDYRYALCGRELWEKPSPLAGYLTSCGNLADGTFAYRAAGLPLTLQRILVGEPRTTSTWEMRQIVSSILLLMRLPFIFFGLWLGGGLWWVARRLYGNEGGFVALALYCFSPEMIRVCVQPNNEVLAAWGMYGVVYTAIGLAHAMQGPARKWRPRLVLLAVALGLTATAHVLAAILALLLAMGFMFYLAEARRPQVLPVLATVTLAGFLLLLASYTFNLDAFSYIFQSGDARLWFSWSGARHMLTRLPNAGMATAAASALVLYVAHRRSRYFGNTTPVLVTALLLSVVATGVHAEPWIWGLPFLLTFIGGVFADVLESRQRRLYLWVTGAILTAQAALSVVSLPLLAQVR